MAVRNTIADLGDYLFEELERLNSPELKGDELRAEMERAKAMSQVGSGIVDVARTQVDALRACSDAGIKVTAKQMPRLIAGGDAE